MEDCDCYHGSMYSVSFKERLRKVRVRGEQKQSSTRNVPRDLASHSLVFDGVLRTLCSGSSLRCVRAPCGQYCEGEVLEKHERLPGSFSVGC